MKWPFVSRTMHEEVVSVLGHSLESERENCRMLRRELADLFGKYQQLVLSGAQPALGPKPVLQVTPLDPITKAVNLASRGNPELRSAMLSQVVIDRAAGKNDVEIAERIRRGNSSLTLEEFAS